MDLAVFWSLPPALTRGARSGTTVAPGPHVRGRQGLLRRRPLSPSPSRLLLPNQTG